jgi:fido (protein-threonine AMPylation protein)
LRALWKFIKQSWIPALLAVAYALWDISTLQEPTAKRFFEKSAAGFFFLMWFVSQFLRAKKQVDDEEQAKMIAGMNDKLTTLLQKESLQIQVEQQVESQKTELQLAADFDQTQRQISKLPSQNLTQEQVQLIRKYAAAAEELANRNFERVRKERIPINKLTIYELLKLHRNIFPPGYEIAGKLRTVRVAISQAGSTTLTGFPGSLVTPDPPHMQKMLEDLLKDWNDAFDTVMKSSREEKLEALARFHQRFSIIHPFLDGNGRLIRILLAQQSKVLFGYDIDVGKLENNQEYFAALSAGDQGDIKPLKKIFDELIKRDL